MLFSAISTILKVLKLWLFRQTDKPSSTQWVQQTRAGTGAYYYGPGKRQFVSPIYIVNKSLDHSLVFITKQTVALPLI